MVGLLVAAIAVQAGIGLWRVAIIYRQGLQAGVRPFAWSTGLALELLLAAALAAVAWWWLPAGRRRHAAQWGIHFLALAWFLALAHLAYGMLVGRLDRAVTWALLGALAAVGALVRRRPAEPVAPTPPLDRAGRLALWGAAGFWALQLPNLVFPYHWFDAKAVWACRAVQFTARGSLAGIFDCQGPERAPVHSLVLWLGHTNPVVEGRLLPILMVGAFGLAFYPLARRVAPRLAPWAVLWLFATNRVYQGAINAYADVPVMIAVAIGLALAVDDGRLVSPRWLALTVGLLAGAAAALIKRDGLAMVGVGTIVLLWTAERRRDARLWMPLLGGVAAYLGWHFRPDWLAAPPQFALKLEQLEPATLSIGAVLRSLWTIFYGMQGQLLSHYAFGLFAIGWLAVAVWLARRGGGIPGGVARRLGLAGLAGWATVALLYVVLTFTGHPHMGTLFIIRTGFSRHLVHTFPLCLLLAAAMVERLLTIERSG
ncbi:MAG TPA: hypothetical protein VNK43_06950 [Gemmatimonadales bacterium]|nr:hypothetical protein [Gemmatimonadales bacterium]